MSQKSSLPQVIQFVSEALMPDNLAEGTVFEDTAAIVLRPSAAKYPRLLPLPDSRVESQRSGLCLVSTFWKSQDREECSSSRWKLLCN
jgi:hypothetical protein